MPLRIRRTLTIALCTSAALILPGCRQSRKKAVADTPIKPVNVVLITLDTVRPDHLHCYGYAKIKTPNIDALAGRGVLFERAVAQTPLTAPSHASMLTGENPNVNGVRNNGGFALQPSSATLASILAEHGWDTGGFVSSTVLKRVFGFSHGFATYDDRMAETSNGLEAPQRPANVTVDHAIEWLNARPDKRFFLWLHLYDAHLPYHPPAEFARKYPGDPYDAEIAFEDQQLGRFLDALRKKSPDNRTIIALLSDHGESLGDHGEYEHGFFLYDSTVRIAWIAAGPGIPGGVRVRHQAREIDLLPTLLDLLGTKPPSAIQGTSMVPAFFGKPAPSTYSYEETLAPKINMGWAELRGIHTAHWMYVRAPRPELYDLDHDPGELTNVIAAHPKRYRELDSQLKKLSGSAADGVETVTLKNADPATMAQLKSLGYVSDFSSNTVKLNGGGDDPRDHVATMETLQTISITKGISATREAAMLEQALRTDPANPTLYEWLIHAYERAGMYAEATRACLDALHHGISDGAVDSRLAGLYVRQGDLKNAILYYRRAAELDPLDVASQNDLATAYMQTGQLADAERMFRWVLAVQQYAPAYNGLGIVADKRNDLPGARKDFKQAVLIDPGYLEGQLNLGIACVQMHDYPCARTAFRAFVAKAPANYGSDLARAKAALTMMGDR